MVAGFRMQSRFPVEVGTVKLVPSTCGKRLGAVLCQSIVETQVRRVDLFTRRTVTMSISHSQPRGAGLTRS